LDEQAEYWLRLGRRVSHALSASRDNHVRFLAWLDGVIPDTLELDLERSVVRFKATIDEGKTLIPYVVTLRLSRRAVDAFRTDDWQGLLPTTDPQKWLKIDRAEKTIEITCE